MEKICRTCLRTSNVLLPLFDDTNLPVKIKVISDVRITNEAHLPKTVCAECVININLSYNFRRILINSDKQLKNPKQTVPQVALVKINEDFADDAPAVSAIDEDEQSNAQIDFIKVDEEFAEQEAALNGSDEDEQSNSNTSFKTNEEVVNKRKNIESHKLLKYKRKYACTQCDFTTPSNVELFQHKKTHGVRRRVCNVCGLSVTVSNYNKHVANHTINPVACPECGKMCKNFIALRYHKMRHKDGKSCEHCGRYYKNLSSYRIHVRINHSGGAFKKYPCNLCDKVFNASRDLQRHIRSHTGERPYLCKYCQRGFSSSNALKTHIRQHTNERPYVCEFCGAAFKQRISLRNHWKMAHPESNQT